MYQNALRRPHISSFPSSPLLLSLHFFWVCCVLRNQPTKQHTNQHTRPNASKHRDVCDCDTETCCADEDCFNRMLHIECSVTLCPCEKECQNRRFQKHHTAKTEKFDAGKKGWGLRPLNRLKPGSLIGEYVGEVIDPSMMLERKAMYSEKGNTHHFFMNLTPQIVIDATVKGAKTRFLNHSCDPNCELQKWTVNGEFRLGFFTKRTIEALEEVTFDYQYERDSDVAQECFCGSDNCRGLIIAASAEDRAGSGSGSGKRRRLDPAVKAARELDALRKRLQKLTGVGQSDDVGGLQAVGKVRDLLRMMISNGGGDDQKQEFMEVLMNTQSEECLNEFLRVRGLRMLSGWLDVLTTGAAKHFIMKTLDHLPIGTKNVVDSAGIIPALEGIVAVKAEGDDDGGEVATLASTLIEKWSTLKTVYVIQKVDTGMVTKEVTIPRTRLKQFQTTALRQLTEKYQGASADYSKDNSNPDSRALKITGPEKAVDDCIAEVQEMLAKELVSPTQDRRRSSTGAEDQPGSPSAKRRRISDSFANGASARKVPLPAMERTDALPFATGPNAVFSPGIGAGGGGLAAAAAGSAVSGPGSGGGPRVPGGEPPLPLPWQSVWDEESKDYYYWNETTNETTWTRPDVTPVLAPQPPKTGSAGQSGGGGGGGGRSNSSSRSSSAVAKEKKESEDKKEFRTMASKAVIKVLQRYTKPDCKVGRITNNDDFKHLARKITHHVVEKEFSAAAKSGKLDFNDSVKHKLKNFCKSYMQKTGAEVFVRKETSKKGKRRQSSSSSSSSSSKGPKA